MTDRELDALVAEKVMGWTAVTNRRTADGTWTGVRHDGDMPVVDDIPCYSTSIGVAWQVVEHFLFPLDTQEAYHLRASFWYYMDDDHLLYAWKADIAARIICRAALKAYQVNLPKEKK